MESSSVQNIFGLLLAKKDQQVAIEPLAAFRILFGFLMFLSILRFLSNNWVELLYIQPSFHFKYFGFEWVKALPGNWMYLPFILMLVSSLGIMLGWKYRASALLFFLSFSYVELVDVTYYLNHYYFVSLVAFLLILLPANAAYSLDAHLSGRAISTTKLWHIGILRFQLVVLYFFAGIAKINPDWLLEAMPLANWLPALSHLPVFGPLLLWKETAFVFSWFGCLYDLSVWAFLLYRPTRPFAYAAVVVFHLFTGLFFQIGMFPYIMIALTLVFFHASFHKPWLEKFAAFLTYLKKPALQLPAVTLGKESPLLKVVLVAFIVVQLLLPFRYLAYEENLFWHEQGYRFSWRVMLMEKSGSITYFLTDPSSKRKISIDHAQYLTPTQEKQLATQPDLILQFAHYLRDKLEKKGIENPIITATAFVTLNNSGSRLFIDPELNLSEVQDSFSPKKWILPFKATVSQNRATQ